MKDIDDISPTFCIHPWVNLEVYNTGGYDFCCITQASMLTGEHGERVTVTTHTPKEAWNVKSLREVRKAMLEGEKLDVCKTCWLMEDIGKESYRQRHNQEWHGRLGNEELQRRVLYSKRNDYHVDVLPEYLDLRLGNICNLKCRMCNVWNSNQIEKEHMDLKSNNTYADIWLRQYKTGLNLSGQDINIKPVSNEWLDSNDFWEHLNEFIPNLEKVYFTGGEPTLVEANYTFMKEMIAQGFEDHIDLFFNTNCTNIQPRWLETISKFKNIQINASIDGVGEVNNYIRFPSHWKSIYKNLISIANLKNVNLDLSPVIQTYNILDIENLLQLAQDISKKTGKVVDVDFLMCTVPFYLDPVNLNEQVKNIAFLRLQRWQTSWLYDNSPVTRNSIDSYLTFLESEQPSNWKDNIIDFWNMTKIHDQKRKQSFKDSIPELYELIHD